MQKALIFSMFSLGVALSPLFVVPASADDPTVYYVSMRALTGESAPSFVTVSRQQAGEYSASVAGCDDVAYYATPTGTQAIAAARTAGKLVQLHRGLAGQTPQASAIICIIDASGS